ncbi:MAG: hypothetical protein H0V86_01160 [Chloroflexia bacterium]|nr:hypothetical protein [Chloroflexia bacterium]
MSADRVRSAQRELVDGLHDGALSETAYDTAIVSRLRDERDPGQSAFPSTNDWLRWHQHADGSWGGRIETGHDRLVSTLAAVIALTERSEPWARRAILDGVKYICDHAAAWETCPYETVAFELLVPQLLLQARSLGLKLPYDRFVNLGALQTEKLGQIPPGLLYEEPTTLVHSLEFMNGQIDTDRVHRLRATNGSYGNSPSATAHVLGHVRDGPAEIYLRRVLSMSVNGGVPTTYPIDTFERSWVLYNLGHALAAHWGPVRTHLHYLANSVTPEGFGWSRGLIPDSDSTAVALAVLDRAGFPVEVDVLLRFERDGHFSCFPFERNSSITANAHVLEALRLGEAQRPGRFAKQCAKIVRHLEERQLDRSYWLDKWHVSPYYATAHVTLAAGGIADHLLTGTEAWLLETQHSDGAWGEYAGTSEETAYAMQALYALPADSLLDVTRALQRGASYLSEHFDDSDYPELWIGKGLYTPYAVVRSAVIAALILYHRGGRV